MKKSLDIAAIVLTSLLLLGFALLSLRGFFDPQQAAVRFGAPVSDAAGALFYRVYLSRNLVIAIAGAVFLLTRQWTPLAILLAITVALPVFDMTVLSLNGVTPPVFHPVALVLLALAAALLWRRAVASKS
jgi:hypothetical protein